ncbi:helix-turn-helix transcriptional regulator [Lachnospiraceae bacterium 47-T17]
MNLGTRLKNTLEARGMTVTQFAKEASIPAQTIYALINRDSNKADMDLLVKLLKALHTDFFTFMEADAAVGAANAPASVEHAPEKIIEKIVEKIVVKEVPAPAPEGKHIIHVDSDVYDQILALAKDEGIEDEAVIAQALEAYLELGFGYRQRPLRSILRDYVPKVQRPGDMDSFLL